MDCRPALHFWARSVAVALLGVWASVAHAAEPASSNWFVTGQGQVRLIAASPGAGTGDTVQLGLQFQLAPHWKIYWRSPGDAGYPPRLDWTGSTNLKSASLAWPAPIRFSLSGLETIGYQNEVVLPVLAQLEHAGEAVHIQAALQYLTCAEICIPYETTFSLDLPVTAPAGAGPANGFADLIAQYQEKVPGDGKTSGLAVTGAEFEASPKPVLVLRLAADPSLAHPDAFIEGPAGIGFGPPALDNEDSRHPVLRVPVSISAKNLPGFTGKSLAVTIIDGARSVETEIVPSVPPSARPEAGTLLPMIVVALLGGLILNAMPCVLPVLSIKLLAAVKHADGGRRAVRRGFLASAFGILLAFLLLASAIVVLRRAGVAIGWGAQFQQPLFLAAMVVLLTLFAANLWDLFEISLPRAIANRIGPRGRPSDESILGNVASGALATLLATPCSAPFLGTAVGFALAGSSLDILVIFLALGLGLAFPYLAVAAMPGLALRLPRPGRWMITLRRALGLALIGTALWLLYVLRGEIGGRPAVVIAAAMAAFWIVLSTLERTPARGLGTAAMILLTLAVPALVPVLPMTGRSASAADELWQNLAPDRIAALVGEGKVVFVDVTADWCLTCQVNKRLVLDQAPVRDELRSPGLVAMQADWTRPDPAIAAYLKMYGRYGIPFNAVYGPGAPSGIALSELLTSGEVMNALERARGDKAASGAGASPPDGG